MRNFITGNWQVSLLFLAIVSAAAADDRKSAEAPSNDNLSAWLDQQIENALPKPEEKKFDQIAWAADIRHALKLAKEHGRPVFLFTHDGQIDTGRC